MTDSWGQQPQQPWGPPQGQPQQQYAAPPPPQQQPWGPPQGQQPQLAPPPQGQPQQQAPQGPPPPSPDELFQQAVEGAGTSAGGPSFYFGEPGASMFGQIVSRRTVPKTDTKTGAQRYDKNGNPLWQVLVVVQTELRNWAYTNPQRPPKDRHADGSETLSPPQNDTGLRTIYLWYTLRDAVVEAVSAAGQNGMQDGWWIAVKFTHGTPNPQGGNPIRQYKAFYAPTREALFAAIGVQAPPAAAPQPQQPAQQQAPVAPPAPQQAPPPPVQQQPVAPPAPPQQQAPWGPPQDQQAQTPYQGEPPF